MGIGEGRWEIETKLFYPKGLCLTLVINCFPFLTLPQAITSRELASPRIIMWPTLMPWSAEVMIADRTRISTLTRGNKVGTKRWLSDPLSWTCVRIFRQVNSDYPEPFGKLCILDSPAFDGFLLFKEVFNLLKRCLVENKIKNDVRVCTVEVLYSKKTGDTVFKGRVYVW